MMSFPVLYVPFLPAEGMAIFPFILIKHKKYRGDKVLIRHENIHLVQQMELLLIGFYILYLLHYLFNLLRYNTHHKAYMRIVFEKEAFQMEKDASYLTKRALFAWVKFL